MCFYVFFPMLTRNFCVSILKRFLKNPVSHSEHRCKRIWKIIKDNLSKTFHFSSSSPHIFCPLSKIFQFFMSQDVCLCQMKDVFHEECCQIKSSFSLKLAFCLSIFFISVKDFQSLIFILRNLKCIGISISSVVVCFFGILNMILIFMKNQLKFNRTEKKVEFFIHKLLH